MSKILAITGATGKKSGGVLAEHIAANIEQVNSLFPDGLRALVRQSSDVSKLKQLIPEIEIFRGDFFDSAFLRKALAGVDILVHVAGITLSEKIVEAAAHVGVNRVILVHTTGIYSKYKKAGEEYRRIDEYVYSVCRKNNILLTILRPTMIYGNETDHNVIKFIEMVDKLPVMPVVNGANYELQPVHYADLGWAYYQVLMKEETAGRDYILSGAEPIQLRQMLAVIGKCLGKKVYFFSVPFPIAYFGAVFIYIVTFGKVDYREKVQRLCEPRVFSHKDAQEMFDYCPMRFEEGIVEEVKAYKERRQK